VTRSVLLDPIGGLAGDMFIAAAIAAWPEFEKPVLQAIRDSGLPHGWEVKLWREDKCGLRSWVFRCVGPHESHAGGRHPPADHHRDPTGHYGDFRHRLAAAPLSATTRRHALGILDLLAAAEASVHGVSIDDVHFHELADWDTQADLIGAAAILDLLGEVRWFYRPLPLGGGTVDCSHGPLPVPAPATSRLLEGFAWRDDGVAGERVTPTGAAILRYLLAKPPPATPLGRLVSDGAGAGTRNLPRIPNVLRLLAFADTDRSTDAVLVVEFDIDDQSGEDLAHSIDRLRALDSVRDVALFQGVGKKGRPLQSVRVLADAEGREGLLDAIFSETTTIGARLREEQRVILPRRQVTVNVGDRPVRVKLVERPGGALCGKVEADDVALAGDAGARRELRAAALRQALDDGEQGG
jgi:pyridinium-3,5-bisthiocarboxylic acid mononucleotide nickel chelatase